MLCRGTAGESTFQVVNDRQQIANEFLLLCGGAAVGILSGAFAIIIKVGGETQISVLLLRQRCDFLRLAGLFGKSSEVHTSLWFAPLNAIGCKVQSMFPQNPSPVDRRKALAFN